MQAPKLPNKIFEFLAAVGSVSGCFGGGDFKAINVMIILKNAIALFVIYDYWAIVSSCVPALGCDFSDERFELVVV